MATKIGFLGLGIMGSSMARNCLKAGHDVMVWNRSQAATGPLTACYAKLVAMGLGETDFAAVIKAL